MKFLHNVGQDPHIMLLDIHYHPGNRYKSKEKDDYIDILYKDMDTGQKFVETIIHPDIEIWVVKEEFRTFTHVRNFIPKDECIPVRVPYKERLAKIADILNCDYKDVVKTPYAAQLDMSCESFYEHQFKLEYGNTLNKILDLGFLDIENDMVAFKGMADYGEAPVDSVSFVADKSNTAYLFVNTNEYLPHLPENHKYYAKYEELRKRFHENMDHFKSHPDEFIDKCHEMFDEVDAYKDIEYKIYFFDVEIELIAAVFQVIEKEMIDILGIWNSPYDIQALIERCKALGYDPNQIIANFNLYKQYSGTEQRNVYFKEDKNPLAHKRKHSCELFTPYIVMCQMRNYAGIRSARGKLPSLKLGNIASLELKDTKIDYSEYGEIKWFKYRDMQKFFLYSMKDTLLLRAMARKTRDYDAVYNIINRNVVLPSEEFVSTKIIENTIRHFAFNYKRGYVLGSNKNKWEQSGVIDYNKFFKALKENEKLKSLQEVGDETILDDDEANLLISEEIDEDNLEFYDPTEFAQGSESAQDKNVRVKFVGAFVLNTGHIQSTGFRIYEVESRFIHEFVIDFDVRSEYPSAILAMNASNETMLGKVFLSDMDDVKLPVYEQFRFVGKEESENAKIDPAAWIMEQRSTGDYLNLGHVALHLPNIEDILQHIGNNINEFKKGD